MKIDNEFIRTHAHIVRCIVRQFGKTNFTQDLMQEGYIGLVEAAKRYDPNTGVQFDSYASWWVRKYVREYIIRYGQTVSLPAKTKDIFDHITEDVDAVCYEEDGDPITFADCIADDAEGEKEWIHQQEINRLRKALQGLSEREQDIIRLIYGIGQDKLPQAQIAQQLGITTMTVWRIHDAALKKLKKMLF